MPFNKTLDKETFQTTVRIPKTTYESIKRLAEKDGRDISKQINFMLKKYIEIRGDS